MPPLEQTPGGVVLPSGTTIATVIPALGGGRTPVHRGGRGGVPRAADTGQGPPDGVPRSYQETYDTQQYVGSVVNKLARHFARVPLLTERFDTVRRGDVVRKRWTLVDEDHPLPTLLNRPSPGFGPYAFKLSLGHGLLVEGNSLTYKHRDEPDGPPTQLFPLTWDRHVPYRLPGGLIDRWYSHEVPGGTRVFDARRDILHVGYWSRSGAEGQLGISPLEQLAGPLRSDDAAERHAYAFLAGGMHPSGAFQLPADVELTPEIENALRTVVEVWSGVDAAGGVPIIAGGGEYKTHQPNAKDAALIETRQHSLDEVCMVLDVSPVTIHQLRHATQRGNVAEILRDLYTGSLAPPISVSTEAINLQLVEPEIWDPTSPDERLRVRADVSEFTRGDPEKWSKDINERIRHGRMSINEGREADGKEPWDDERADEPMILDSNIHPLAALGEEIVQTVRDEL